MKKIKLIFEGGLGNQLFQLAYGKYLQNKFECDVQYDISKFKTESVEYREFELDSFKISKSWKRGYKKGKDKTFWFSLHYIHSHYLFISSDSYIIKKYEKTNYSRQLVFTWYQHNRNSPMSFC